MIVCEQLQFRYATQTEPSCIIPHLTILRGECVVLCGESGCGKSTFLRILNGLVPDFYDGEVSGRCVVSECDVLASSVEEVSTKVGSVFQNPATQFFHRRVEDELVFPCENQGVPRDVIACHLRETVKLFEIEHLLERDLLSASGGERQRIAVATSVMQQPEVIVLDEPTANLDQSGIERVVQQLSLLKEAGVTIIIAEHRLDFLHQLADRYLYFKQGRLEHDWSRQAYEALSDEQRHALGLRSAQVATISLPKVTDERCGLALEQVEGNYVKRAHTVKFPVNQVIGVTGLNGTGKTTLASMVAGLTKHSGEIMWGDTPLTARQCVEQTALVMQEVRLQLHCETVEKELRLGAKQTALFNEIVAALELESLLARHPMTLSGGQQQRVMIANALLSDKRVFIFDEPTSGLDYRQMRRVAKLLKQLKSEERVILVITHDIELLKYACESVYHIE